MLMKNENRLALFMEYHDIPRHFYRPFLEYDRYYEADLIIAELKRREVDLSKLKVLDYGCGIGDYTMAFLREGSHVAPYDEYEEVLNFLRFRMEKEKFNLFDFDERVSKFEKDCDLVILGEVLEHLPSPIFILKKLMHSKHLFTTAFPYVTDLNYFNKGGHNHGGFELQKECAEFLEKHYEYVRFDGQLRLWTLKENV